MIIIKDLLNSIEILQCHEIGDHLLPVGDGVGVGSVNPANGEELVKI
jgi:hypothetical protein